jgi:hypothetical protein
MKMPLMTPWFVAAGLTWVLAADVRPAASGPLDDSCVVSILNRTVIVRADGSWVLPNIPANIGRVRARATCVRNGITTAGQSDYFVVPPNGVVNNVPPIVFDAPAPIPAKVTISAPQLALVGAGMTTQLTTTATTSDGTTVDISSAASGTNYTTSNPAIASVSADGLVTAVASGAVLITALNDGTLGMLRLTVQLSADSDGDGIPDDYELAHGLNPNDPTDALEDPDHDGLTNLQEYQLGTDPHNPDTDGDGLPDGLEVKKGTNPLLYDTDGGGIGDGLEVQAGTNPLDPSDDDQAIGPSLASVEVVPPSVIIYMNTILGEGSAQLKVVGHLLDGHTIDLTSAARGTNYASSDLSIVSFGGIAGQVFGGSGGTATVTVTNHGFTVPVAVTVNAFAPTALSYVAIPGYANGVDVGGNLAYVAAGAAGLQVVDVSDRRQPHIVGSLDVGGNANDVKVGNGVVFVAAGPALVAVDVSDPTAPVTAGSVAVPGTAQGLAVRGAVAYVGTTSGLAIVDITDPRVPLVLGTLATGGAVGGLDVNGTVAVLAGAVAGNGASGVATVDVSDPAQPTLLGHLVTTAAQRVVSDGATAFLADYTGSLATIDIRTPAAPRLLARETGSLGGYLLDVAKQGAFTFGADVFFVNGVPISNVSDPTNPQVAARLDFTARDDNGTGIAADNQYVYLTAGRGLSRPGTTGDTRLYIGQYLQIVDNAGIPPTATITRPLPGTDVVAGRSVTVHVEATDDFGVAAVVFSVDGVPAATVQSPPYDFSYLVPLSATSVTFTATAVDFGNNAGQAAPVTIVVHPDQPPVVTLTAPDPGLVPLERTPILLAADASDADGVITRVQFAVNGRVVSTRVSPPYQVSYTVPSGVTSLDIRARAVDDVGQTTDTPVLTLSVAPNPAPPAPDLDQIVANVPAGGVSQVVGQPGAVLQATSIQATNLNNGAATTAVPAADGSFGFTLPAVPDDVIALVAVNANGLASPTTLVPVRTTQDVAPAAGATSLHFEGVLVDRVGPSTLAPDGDPDAVFTVSANIGAGVTRQLSFVDLVGPLTRSTRPGAGGTLGVAADAGAPLQNAADGTVSGAYTSSVALTLFAADAGFVVPGQTYTVTLGFTDGSRFVGTFQIVAPQDKAYVAHSAHVTALPATVVGQPGTPGGTTLTIDGIRDIDGTLVPDGAKVAIAVADMAANDAGGSPVRSAGGTLLDGNVAVNNPGFHVYTIQDGKVTALYSSDPVTPPALTGSLTVVQVLPADAAENVLGNQIVASLDLNLRAPVDAAIPAPAPSQLYADSADHRSEVTIAVRQPSGQPVPDGTMVVVTAANCGSRNPDISCIGSAGGSILGGMASPSGGIYRAFTVAGGSVSCEYSSSGVVVGVRQTGYAVLQVLPANASGAVTSSVAIGTASIALSGPASAETEVSMASVPLVTPPVPVTVRVHHVHDTRGALVPDGTKLILSATNCAMRTDSIACIGSAGGTFTDGAPSPSGGIYQVYTVQQASIVGTYSAAGLSAGTGGTVVAALQLGMADPSGALRAANAIASYGVQLTTPSNSVGAAQPAKILGDAALHVSTVTFTPVIDSFGNALPEGALVVATAVNCGARNLDISCIGSFGGQVLNGTASPSGGIYKVLSVDSGRVVVSYGDQGLGLAAGEVETANVALLPSNQSGAITSSVAFGVAPVTLSGLTSLTGSANPPLLYADGGDQRTTVTLTNIKDAFGQTVPDGTQVAVSATNCAARFADVSCVNSAGGVIVGGTPSPSGGIYRVFAVQNGQVVLEYSAQGVSLSSAAQAIAVVQVVPARPDGSLIGSRVAGTVSVQLGGAGGATVAVSPSDLLADGVDRLVQVTVSHLVDADGVTPIPDGAKVVLSAANCAARDANVACIPSQGGQLRSAGVTPGDGDPSPSGGSYRVFTVAGGQVQAAYSDVGIEASAGQSLVANVVAIPASPSGGLIGSRAFATGTVNLRGITSAVAAGPATVAPSGGTATITFTGIKDAAGNTVPDGTQVVVTAGNCALRDQSIACLNSIGGTITGGGSSPSGGIYQVFAVTGGSVTVTYSSPNATGTARIQVGPADGNGALIGGQALSGGVWAITVQ